MEETTTEVVEMEKVGRISELALLTINKAAKLMSVDRSEIYHAMDVYVQSGGRDGLPFLVRGSRRSIRAGAIREYLLNQERKVLFE